jgi:Ion channel
MVLWALILSLALILAILIDAFEAVILPRRATARMRPTRLVYKLTWALWSYVPRRLPPSRARASFLSWYGPLSMFMLLAMWAIGLILGFGLLEWGLGSPIKTQAHESGFFVDLYLSGTTFFTLGLGDVTPHSTLSRLLTVIEAGLGFGFLALVIGYLPVLYTAFSKREIQISMLDVRAGSPPSASEILVRLGRSRNLHQLQSFLADWEFTGAETLETHMSYPVLMYYRSHHDNQSWLASITAVLDTCALVLSGIEGVEKWQAQNTFAMLRHCLVELGRLLNQTPKSARPERLNTVDFDVMCEYLALSGVKCLRTPEAQSQLAQYRSMYEPYVAALSDYLLLSTPCWDPQGPVRENWKTSSFERPDENLGSALEERAHEGHGD